MSGHKFDRNFVFEQKEKILHIAGKHGASNVRLFGSVSRNEAGPESDVDLLVDLEPDRSLLDQASLIADLEDLLEHPVDIVLERSLKPRIRQRILDEAIAL